MPFLAGCVEESLSLSLSEQAIIFLTCSCACVCILVFVVLFSDWSVCVLFVVDCLRVRLGFVSTVFVSARECMEISESR